MPARPLLRPALLALGASALFAASASAAGPPPPTAAGGQAVETVATGVPTPTSFAFAGTTVFAGSGPNEVGPGPGGLFVLSGGVATKVPNTPAVVFGLAWRSNTLYLSSGMKITAFTGWNGTTFSGSKTVSTGKKGFPGFNGLAFGPDGRLYAGVSLNQKYDHANNPAPLAQSVVSMTPSGKDLKVVSTGLRQPFQLTFPTGSKYPYVTSLSQDKGKVPPDEIVKATPGADFGFPTCTWLVPSAKACKGDTKPAFLLPKHSSPMGIGSKGSKQLFVALFAGTGKGPEVVSATIGSSRLTPFLTGFAAPVIGLSLDDSGNVWVGDLTGTIYKVPSGS